jgi:hypothetical protein
MGPHSRDQNTIHHSSGDYQSPFHSEIPGYWEALDATAEGSREHRDLVEAQKALYAWAKWDALSFYRGDLNPLIEFDPEKGAKIREAVDCLRRLIKGE